MSEIVYDSKLGNLELSNTLGLTLSGTSTRVKHTGSGTMAVSSTGPVTLESSDTTSGITIGATTSVPVTIGSGGGSVTLGASDVMATFNGDVTITGDLTVSGDTVSHDVVTIQTEDPILRLNEGTTGANTSDIGFVGDRGTTGNPVGFFWDESADQFACASFATGSLSTATVTITDYENLRCGAMTIDDTLGVSGASTLNSTLTVGSDGTGYDVTFHSATSGDNMLWDASAKKLVITGTNAQTAFHVDDGNSIFDGTVTFNDTVTYNTTIVVENYDIEFYGSSSSTYYWKWDASEDKVIINTPSSATVGFDMLQGSMLVRDNGVINLGTSSDLQFTHNGTNSLITSTTGDLTIDNTNTTGSTIVQLGTDTSATDFQVQNNSGSAILTVAGDGTTTMTGNMALLDNDQFIVGTGSDMILVHNGTNTSITTATGDFTVDNTNTSGSTIMQLGTDTSATDFQVQNNSGTALLTVDGSGVTALTGNLTLQDNDSIIVGTGSDFTLVHNATNTLITSTTGDFTVDNTNTSGSTIMQLGTDTSATDFQVQNNSGAALLTIDASSQATIAGDLSITSASTSGILLVTSTQNAASTEVAKFSGNPNRNSTNSEGYLSFSMEDAGNNDVETSRIKWLGAPLNNGGSAAADLIFSTLSSNTITDAFTIDGSATQVTSAWAMHVNTTLTGGSNSNVYGASIAPTGITTPGTSTNPVVASLHIKEPIITNGDTITNAATVYIEDAPSEGGTGNFALWVDAGAVKLDETLEVDGVVTLNNNLTLQDNDSLIIGAGSDLSIVHNATNTVITSATGDLLIDNTNATGSTILQLGTDDANTDIQLQNNTGTALLTVTGAGVATIAGNASGTDALVLTAGDILLTSGHLDMTVGDLTLADGSVSITDADNAASLSVTNNTVTTADALVDVVSTSLTTGAMMRINANTGDHDGEILELIGAGDSTSTGKGLSVAMNSVTTGAATGIDVVMSSATTTAKGIAVTMDAITTGDMLYLDNGGASMTGDGKFINCNDDNVSVFSVAADGLTTIAGNASGTDALVLTAGDILVTSGHLDMTVGDLTLADGSVSVTDADNAASLSVTNNTVTTADAVVDIASTSLTTGAMMRINANTGDHDGEVLELIGAGDATSTGTGLSINMNSVTTGAATGINITMSAATTTAKGIAVTMDAITTGDMLYLDNGGNTMTGDGKFINCNDDDVSVFSVGPSGNTVISGTLQVDGDMTLESNEPYTIGHVANGAGDDLTISQTGSVDASLLLTSAGTGTDAIGLTSSAGGISLSSNAATDFTSTLVTGSIGHVAVTTAYNTGNGNTDDNTSIYVDWRLGNMVQLSCLIDFASTGAIVNTNGTDNDVVGFNGAGGAAEIMLLPSGTKIQHISANVIELSNAAAETYSIFAHSSSINEDASATGTELVNAIALDSGGSTGVKIPTTVNEHNQLLRYIFLANDNGGSNTTSGATTRTSGKILLTMLISLAQ